MKTWLLMVALFNVHTGEMYVKSDPVASFETAKECVKALTDVGPRKPDKDGIVLLYECRGPYAGRS